MLNALLADFRTNNPETVEYALLLVLSFLDGGTTIGSFLDFSGPLDIFLDVMRKRHAELHMTDTESPRNPKVGRPEGRGYSWWWARYDPLDLCKSKVGSRKRAFLVVFAKFVQQILNEGILGFRVHSFRNPETVHGG